MQLLYLEDILALQVNIVVQLVPKGQRFRGLSNSRLGLSNAIPHTSKLRSRESCDRTQKQPLNDEVDGVYSAHEEKRESNCCERYTVRYEAI